MIPTIHRSNRVSNSHLRSASVIRRNAIIVLFPCALFFIIGIALIIVGLTTRISTLTFTIGGVILILASLVHCIVKQVLFRRPCKRANKRSRPTVGNNDSTGHVAVYTIASPTQQNSNTPGTAAHTDQIPACDGEPCVTLDDLPPPYHMVIEASPPSYEDAIMPKSSVANTVGTHAYVLQEV